jgi:lipopolysaccharide biosynthesis glycosyltransferase
LISVLYACNAAYLRQTIISAASVLMHNVNVHLYFALDGTTSKVQCEIENTLSRWSPKITFVKLEDLLSNVELGKGDRHPRTIYAKLFMEQVVEEDRILYLDSDVIVNGSLDELFGRNMEKEYVAGVMMPYSSKLKKEIAAVSGEPYICDGVVLFNMELWKEEQLTESCRSYIESCCGVPPMMSEGTLNHVCAGKIGVLSPEYNLMPSMIMYSLQQITALFKADCYYKKTGEMRQARNAPIIIHFMNELYNRPWQKPCDHPYKEIYYKIEKMVFGDNTIINKPLSGHIRATRMLKKYLPFSFFAKLYHAKNGL